MTPAQAIAQLDRQLAKAGQDIAFRRGATEQGAWGKVDGYKPEQLVGLLTQADQEVIVSPTSLGSYEPKQDDDFTTGGKLGKVMSAQPRRMQNVIVRWNIVVRMA
ncbi:hypothetical protein [Devosia sp. Root635]|uniref:hypothetical protein n=1 Tax=Devosia sp. Root635 TaxID=1736575 RepID=UPI0006FB1385|nr:hypothetical protein [Devosia sp. Root635]KRA42097.1 hypothetical protein ASD80_10240 [Devosia sp. Root635]